jgi:hypothetical protein
MDPWLVAAWDPFLTVKNSDNEHNVKADKDQMKN